MLVAPAIVHAANIMPVRAIEALTKPKTLVDRMNDLYYGDDSLTIDDICRAAKFMKEANIPIFAGLCDGHLYYSDGFLCYVRPAILRSIR